MVDLHQSTCALTSQAAVSCPEIIGYAHALYHGLDNLAPHERARHIIEIREGLDKLTAAVVAVERRLAAEIAVELEDA